MIIKSKQDKVSQWSSSFTEETLQCCKVTPDDDDGSHEKWQLCAVIKGCWNDLPRLDSFHVMKCWTKQERFVLVIAILESSQISAGFLKLLLLLHLRERDRPRRRSPRS